MGSLLTSEDRAALLLHHRSERDGRIKDRLKAVLLRDDGMSYSQIAAVLFLSHEGVRQQVEDYLRANGKLAPENGGSQARLGGEQAQKLIDHLDAELYVRTRDIVAYVKTAFGITYSVRGLTAWLHQHGFSYHQPVGVPAKASVQAQSEWIAWYEAFRNRLPDNEKILFLDGVHPTHAVRFVRGWIKKGTRREIPTNGSQKRLNILGALDLENMAVHTQEYDTIDADAIIAFLTHVQTSEPDVGLHIILDQARYHTCAAVADWVAKNPCINLHFLPAYSPNLNTIERLWKIMHENTTNNQYLPTFKAFTQTIRRFFSHVFPQKAGSWIDRLTDNFTPRGSPLTSNC